MPQGRCSRFSNAGCGAGFQRRRAILQSPARSWKSYDVIPEIDIWRAASLMLKRYGEKALEESAARIDELVTAGDDDGVAVWRRISDAVGQLANTTPTGPVH